MFQAFKQYFQKGLFKPFLVVSLFLLTPLSLQAKTLVLVHGYLSNASIWNTSGFSQVLERNGFVQGDSYNFNPWGMMVPRPIASNINAFYRVELPSQTNLQTQEGILLQYLQHLYAQRQEPLTLIGHSAGGLVARLFLLDPKTVPVNGLITIATPHLGTPTADLAYLAGNSPIGMMISMVGEQTLQDSRGLLSDLKEEKPGSFLFWMNRQPYPNLHYASIVRKNESISKPKKFDFIVPAVSQDMNNVWSLRNRSGVAITTDNHALGHKDALVVLDILRQINN
jgi:triacylglycerol esterase/lipase EstA (alpha/beta hydrolase family)